MSALIANMDAEDHARHRKDLQPAFSLQSIRSFELHMNKHILGLKEVLLGMFDGSETVSLDLNPWINFQAFDIISDFVFGKPFGFGEAREDSFNLMQVMEERLTIGNAIGVLPTWIRPYLPYVPFDPFWHASLASILWLRKLVTESYFEREAAGDFSRSDLLSFMLSAKSEDGNPLPDPRAISQFVAMVIAGSHSTAASIVHMIDFSRVKRKCRTEFKRSWLVLIQMRWSFRGFRRTLNGQSCRTQTQCCKKFSDSDQQLPQGLSALSQGQAPRWADAMSR